MYASSVGEGLRDAEYNSPSLNIFKDTLSSDFTLTWNNKRMNYTAM